MRSLSGKIVFLFILVLPGKSLGGVVLLYHHVANNTPAITSIKIEQFEMHLKTIEEQGFEVLSLEELTRNSIQRFSLDKQLAITFDDGYKDIITNAFPLLKKRGWPFTVFVSTKYIGISKSYLTWADLAYLKENGATISNHTHTHTHLVRKKDQETHEEWKNRIKSEILTAQRILESKGYLSRSFAYPYGEYNPEILKIISEMDLIGFGQQSGAIGPGSNQLILPRFPLAGAYTGIRALKDKAGSLAMPLKPNSRNPLITDDFFPPMTLEFTWPDLAFQNLNCFGPGGLMNLNKISPNSFVVTPKKELPVGRSRYNCTLPYKNRYFWFSQLWIRKQVDGSWYQE